MGATSDSMDPRSGNIPRCVVPENPKPFSFSLRNSLYDSFRGYMYAVTRKGLYPRKQITSVKEIMKEIEDMLSEMRVIHEEKAKLTNKLISGESNAGQQCDVQRSAVNPIVIGQLTSAQPGSSLQPSVPENDAYHSNPADTTVEVEKGKDSSSKKEKPGSIKKLRSLTTLEQTWKAHNLQYIQCKAKLTLMTDRELGGSKDGRKLVAEIGELHESVDGLRTDVCKTTVVLIEQKPEQPKPNLFPIREAPA